MGFFTDIIRSRALPAIVAALGVSFIAAGLLTYTTGTDADLFPFPSDGTAISVPTDGPVPSGIIIGSIGPSGTPFPSASGAVDVLPSPISSSLPLFTPSIEPSAAPSSDATPVPSSAEPSAAPSSAPTAAPTAVPTAKPVNRVATRVVIPALDIDLPVVKPTGGPTTYPLCNVAMYIQNLSQPGLDGATYLYAHARVGMFLPLLDQSKINNGRGMLGMLVQVYTSDNQYFLYQISEVRRHQLTLTDAVNAQDQELWLQTSEGPHGTPGKLQVIATPVSSGVASQADAHPTPHPVVCG